MSYQILHFKYGMDKKTWKGAQLQPTSTAVSRGSATAPLLDHASSLPGPWGNNQWSRAPHKNNSVQLVNMKLQFQYGLWHQSNYRFI